MIIKLSRLLTSTSVIMVFAFAIPLVCVPAAAQDDEVEISQAEQHFRDGVRLYKEGNFREALNEFNRVLALEPDNENALRYKTDTESQLIRTELGETSRSGEYEIFDPDALTTPGDAALTAEEYKIRSVRENVELGERYLEAEMYKQAIDKFEQVLLTAPDNRRAREGLRAATTGYDQYMIDESQKDLSEQTMRIRREIESKKILPEGAGVDGIKTFSLEIPTIEERLTPRVERDKIEEILDTTVSILFEDIHLKDLLEVLSESYEVNVMVDNRVVEPPADEEDSAFGQAGAPGAPPVPRQAGGGGRFGTGAVGGGGQRQNQQQQDVIVTDGIIDYINLRDVTLRQALKGFLRPLNLDYSVQQGFIWISTPEKIRTESFDDLVTRYYELQNAGAETLFKLVLGNPNSGGGGGGGGGIGGGGGGGGIGGGGGGGIGGGGGGGAGGNSVSAGIGNVSDLFSGGFSDAQVGEYPNPFGSGGGSGGGIGGGGGGIGGGGGGGIGGGGGGIGGGGGGGIGGGGAGGAGGRGGFGPGLGPQGGISGEPRIMYVLRSLVPGVVEPITQKELSFMYYNLISNQLIVHNTPRNHEILAENLAHLDETPQQVAIEAKFLTVGIDDTEKIGFDWTAAFSDANDRVLPPEIQQQLEIGAVDGDGGTGAFLPPPLVVDSNGDGILETIPFGFNPDGSRYGSAFSLADLGALLSPGDPGNIIGDFSLLSTLDGDRLQLTIDMIDNLTESELMSAPRVTTMNQKPAAVADFVTQWFRTSSSTDTNVTTNSTGDAGGVVSATQNSDFTQFFSGIAFSVTPQISGNQVRLWMNPSVVEIVGERTFTERQIIGGATFDSVTSFPIVATQSVWTNVIVLDGDTLVLGGLVSDVTSREEQGVPYLRDIPVIGFFFRGKSNQVRQTSLLIFVTPTIIDRTGARRFESNL